MADFGRWARKKFGDFMSWLMDIDEPTTNDSTESLQSIPTLTGAKNQSGYGKVIPLALGESQFTPYYCGSPYSTISGDDGEEQTFHALYMLGYNGIQCTDFKMGVIDLASNKAKIDNGFIDIDGRWDASKYGIKLELRQDASEVSLYPQKVIEEQLNIELLHPSDGGAKLTLERFSAKNPHIIEIELTSQGLIGYDSDGDKQSKSVGISLEISFDGGQSYQPFARIGGSNSYSGSVSTITRQKNKVMRFVARRTLSYDEALKCKNRIAELRIYRSNPQDSESSTSDAFYLSAIRTWCYDYKASLEHGKIVPQVPVIESRRNITARLGFEIKADEVEFKNQLDAINCIVTAKGRTWNGSSWSDSISANSNPASMLLRVLQHSSRGSYAYPDSRLDMESLGHLYEWCNQPRSQSDTSPKFRCDGMLASTKKTSEIAEAVLKTARAKIVLNDRKYGAWIDEPRNTPVMVLNNQNVLSASNSKSFADLPDGYKIKFVNRMTWQTDEIKVLYDPSKADEPNLTYESMELLFQTDAAQIYQNGMYYLATEKLRPETWNRKVSVDGNLLDIGSMVEIQDDTISVGIGDGAEIKELVLDSDSKYITAIRTDGDIYVDDLAQRYGVKITAADGIHAPKVIAKEVTVSEAGEQSVFRFKEPFYIDLNEPMPSVGNIVSFGFFERETTQALCFGKKDNGDGTFDLTLVPYQPGIYEADSGEIPEFDSKVCNIPERDSSSYVIDNTDEKIADVNKKIHGIVDGGYDSEVPNTPIVQSAVAVKDGVSLYIPADSDGIRNQIKYYEICFFTEDDENGTIEIATNGKAIVAFPVSYPEKDELALYKLKAKVVNIYGKKSEWSEPVGIDTSKYLTWKAPAVEVSYLSAGKESLKSAWDIDTSLTYGDVRFAVSFMYDGEEIQKTSQAILATAEYVFDRDGDKDGYPEKASVLAQLEELGIEAKGRNVELYSVYVKAYTLQKPDSMSESEKQCNAKNYGTWVPESNSRLSARASQDGVSAEMENSTTVYEYGVPYSYVFEIRKTKDDEWHLYKTDSSRLEYSFDRQNGEYPERSDLLGWSVRCKAVSVAGIQSLYYREASIDITGYGTWLVEKPEVATRNSDRSLTLVMSQPQSSLEQYGTIRYKVQIRRPADDADGAWFKPGKSLDPYKSESNYKDGDGFIETGNVYVQTMPLLGQSTKDIKDTLYQFKVSAANEAHESDANDSVFETALCTNIADIVKANETAKSAYITELSSITANLGTIRQGSMAGNDNNFWNLSTNIDEKTGQKRWQGAMRVGGDDQYLEVIPIIINGEIYEYNIKFKVGNFEISSTASNINGEIIVIKDETSLDRTRITPVGTFYEHRETTKSEWFVISQMTTAGIIANALTSDRSLVITNMSIQGRRKAGHDIGRKYLSANSRVWHFDTDMNDQNQQSDLDIEASGEISLVGNEQTGALDYTPAILAVAPYSEIAKSLFGQFQVKKTLEKTNVFTVDFWVQYIWCEDQILFDIGTTNDKIRLAIANTEPYFNEPLKKEPPWNQEIEETGDVIVWNEPFEALSSIIHYGQGNLSPDTDNVKSFKQLGISFEPNTWLHVGIVLSYDKIMACLDKICVEFGRYEMASDEIDIVLNQDGAALKNSFVLDELFIDGTVAEDFESFSRNTDAKIPWGALDKDAKHFILDADGLETNIFEEAGMEGTDYIAESEASAVAGGLFEDGE